MNTGRLLIILLLLFLLTSCDKLDNDPIVNFVSPEEGFIWNDNVTVQISTKNIDNIEFVELYVDSVLYDIDYHKPFSFVLNLQLYRKYILKAKVHTPNSTINSNTREITLSPIPIYDSDLENFHGITETDDQGNLIGNIDEDDWFFNRGIK